MKKLLNKTKKKLTSPFFWAFQVVMFGVALGIPLIVNYQLFMQQIKNLTFWPIFGILVTALVIGWFVEGWLRKRFNEEKR